jgi:hypothetical protein
MEFPKRTKKQNNSLHLFCEQIAEAFNDSGYEQKLTFSSKLDAPWTKEAVKLVFKKIAKAMYNKTSTTELTTQELSKIGQVLERYLSEQGLTIPFPNYEELLIKIEEEEERKKNYQSFKNRMSPEDRQKYEKAFE